MKTFVLENYGKQEIEGEVLDLIEKDERFKNHEFWLFFHESYWPENRTKTLEKLNTLQTGDNILCATVFDGFMQLEIMITILHEFIKKNVSINFYIYNSVLKNEFDAYLKKHESEITPKTIEYVSLALRKKFKESMNQKFLECLEFHNIYMYKYFHRGPQLIKQKDLQFKK